MCNECLSYIKYLLLLWTSISIAWFHVWVIIIIIIQLWFAFETQNIHVKLFIIVQELFDVLFSRLDAMQWAKASIIIATAHAFVIWRAVSAYTTNNQFCIISYICVHTFFRAEYFPFQMINNNVLMFDIIECELHATFITIALDMFGKRIKRKQNRNNKTEIMANRNWIETNRSKLLLFVWNLPNTSSSKLHTFGHCSWYLRICWVCHNPGILSIHFYVSPLLLGNQSNSDISLSHLNKNEWIHAIKTACRSNSSMGLFIVA